MLLRRRFTVLTCALVAAAAAALPASADPSGGANHVVVVTNSTAGATVARASTQVVPVASDTVTSANIAAAINADCTGCHTSAVAVQVLILRGSPSTFTPANVAVATNGGCESCGAYAYARQYVIQTSGSPVLGGAARQRIAELRQEISHVTASILPSDAATDPDLLRDHELDAELDALVNQLVDVVQTGLNQAGTDATVLQDGVDLGTSG